MRSRVHGGREVYLQPGQVVVASEPTVMTAALGSCVVVSLWDAATRTGGMTHFLTPGGDATGARTARAADVALPRLLERMLAAGAQRTRLEARVFGGAARYDGVTGIERGLGAANVAAAFRFLANAAIRLVQFETGGRDGRRVHFDTATGLVRVRLIRSAAARP